MDAQELREHSQIYLSLNKKKSNHLTHDQEGKGGVGTLSMIDI